MERRWQYPECVAVDARAALAGPCGVAALNHEAPAKEGHLGVTRAPWASIGAAGQLQPRRTGVQHSLDAAVKDGVVVVALLAELQEVFAGPWGKVAVELHVEIALSTTGGITVEQRTSATAAKEAALQEETVAEEDNRSVCRGLARLVWTRT